MWEGKGEEVKVCVEVGIDVGGVHESTYPGHCLHRNSGVVLGRKGRRKGRRKGGRGEGKGERRKGGRGKGEGEREGGGKGEGREEGANKQQRDICHTVPVVVHYDWTVCTVYQSHSHA